MKLTGYIFEKSESAYGFAATTGNLNARVKPLWLPRKKVNALDVSGDIVDIYATDGRYGAQAGSVEIDQAFAERIGIA